MSSIRSLQDLTIAGKCVLVRADLNVPLIQEPSKPIKIRDDLRIQAALPTLRWLLDKGAKRLIVMSHLGSPKSRDPSLSLRPIADQLEKLLGEDVSFIEEPIGSSEFKNKVEASSSRVVLLENLRFSPGEKDLSLESNFVEQLASVGDCYVNDAFGTAHREDSSCVALAGAFKKRAAAGFLLEKEVEFLSNHLKNPEHPFVAIVGGAKISSKLGVLEKLLDRCDSMAIVGAMAYTFLLAKGIEVGQSLHEPDFVPQAQEILQRALEMKKTVLLPFDVIVTHSLDPGSVVRLIPTNVSFPEGFEGVDIGRQTIDEIRKLLTGAKTLFWNGPAGVFEQERFAQGTKELAQLLASHPAVTIVGGGDSAAAVAELGLDNEFDHVSTGGGASLELIEKGDLPALKALREAF